MFGRHKGRKRLWQTCFSFYWRRFTPDKEDLQESRNGRRDIRHTRSSESNNKVRETRVLETGESTQERERIQTEVEKEDFLLSQIDEFREKAKQLQDLLAAKENKVQELQSIVNEREGKAEEWQHILVERQEEADKIVTEFTKKVDDLADRVTAKMTEIETSISGRLRR